MVVHYGGRGTGHINRAWGFALPDPMEVSVSRFDNQQGFPSAVGTSWDIEPSFDNQQQFYAPTSWAETGAALFTNAQSYPAASAGTEAVLSRFVNPHTYYSPTTSQKASGTITVGNILLVRGYMSLAYVNLLGVLGLSVQVGSITGAVTGFGTVESIYRDTLAGQTYLVLSNTAGKPVPTKLTLAGTTYNLTYQSGTTYRVYLVVSGPTPANGATINWELST